MSTMQNCQFIKIKVGGSEIAGDSLDKDYKGWIEGRSPGGITMISTAAGIRFDNVNMLIPINTKTVKLVSQYLTKGEKDIELTIVHRQSDANSANYENQKVVYTDCEILSYIIVPNEGEIFADITFNIRGTIEMVWEVPAVDKKGTEKVGPVKYDVRKNEVV